MQMIFSKPDYDSHVTNDEHGLMFYATGQEKRITYVIIPITDRTIY